MEVEDIRKLKVGDPLEITYRDENDLTFRRIGYCSLFDTLVFQEKENLDLYGDKFVLYMINKTEAVDTGLGSEEKKVGIGIQFIDKINKLEKATTN